MSIPSKHKIIGHYLVPFRGRGRQLLVQLDSGAWYIQRELQTGNIAAGFQWTWMDEKDALKLLDA
jgi:hypothetical protein